MMEKDVRRIQLTGRTTYIVSLPKKWVESLGLKSGSLITFIKQPNNALLLIPEAVTKATKIEEATLIIDSKSDESLKRRIISAYLAGYNIIHVRNKNTIIKPSQRESIRDLVKRYLVSTEIISESSNFITIQIFSMSELSIKTVLRRMFLLATSMHKDVIIALRDLNKELAESIINTDDEVDKFSIYIIRSLTLASNNEKILNDMGLTKLSEIPGYRVVVKSIERIADHATSIAMQVKELNDKPDPTLINKIENMSNFVLSMFEDSIEALLRRDYNLADSVADKINNIKYMEEDIMKIIPVDGESNYKLILEDLRRVGEYASDISEVAINHTIEDIIIT